jgi:hypothetical protein
MKRFVEGLDPHGGDAGLRARLVSLVQRHLVRSSDGISRRRSTHQTSPPASFHTASGQIGHCRLPKRDQQKPRHSCEAGALIVVARRRIRRRA